MIQLRLAGLYRDKTPPLPELSWEEREAIRRADDEAEDAERRRLLAERQAAEVAVKRASYAHWRDGLTDDDLARGATV
eukprot:4409217-Prymnesium_polylepis.1